VEDDELNGISDGVEEGAKAQSQPDILKPMFGPKTNISPPQMENAQNYENYRNCGQGSRQGYLHPSARPDIQLGGKRSR